MLYKHVLTCYKFGLKALFVVSSMYRRITWRKSASLKGKFLRGSGCI